MTELRTMRTMSGTLGIYCFEQDPPPLTFAVLLRRSCVSVPLLSPHVFIASFHMTYMYVCFVVWRCTTSAAGHPLP